MQSSKHRREVHKRTHPRITPIPILGSIRMTPKKNKKKSETCPILVKNTPLLMRRCTLKEPGRKTEKS